MYQPLPPITEDLEPLTERLRRERAPKRKLRLHLLVLLKSEQVTSRGQAAAHLALHRNTVGTWLRYYQDRGLEALLTYKEAGAPAGQKTPSRRPCSRNSKPAWRPQVGLLAMWNSSTGFATSLAWRCPILRSMAWCAINSKPS